MQYKKASCTIKVQVRLLPVLYMRLNSFISRLRVFINYRTDNFTSNH
nr:MAG TPA: hypothetical protein [Caudoviricetes sp.]